MKKFRILVVNDDGPLSPLLEPFLDAIAALPWCSEVRVSIPAENQSWKSQCVTRLGPVSAARTHIGRHNAYLIGGTPADAATIGIFNLFDTLPDVVFSGINVGTNTGLPFFLSSGTVGASMLSAMSQIPSLALSAHIPSGIFQLTKSDDNEALSAYAGDWQRIALSTAAVAGKLLEEDCFSSAQVFSVNVPWNVNGQSPLRFTKLQPLRYGRMFRATGDGRYRHDLDPLIHPDGLEEGPWDLEELEGGAVTVTPVGFSFEAQLPEDFLSRFR